MTIDQWNSLKPGDKVLGPLSGFEYTVSAVALRSQIGRNWIALARGETRFSTDYCENYDLPAIAAAEEQEVHG